MNGPSSDAPPSSVDDADTINPGADASHRPVWQDRATQVSGKALPSGHWLTRKYRMRRWLKSGTSLPHDTLMKQTCWPRSHRWFPGRHVRVWHLWDMPTSPENVRWSGKSGSHRRTVKVTRLTRSSN